MEDRQRLRVTFGKGEAIKYISHLDLCTAWERALRRAELGLAYSQGFHPQARLQLAAALPLGYTSRAELMDVILNQSMSIQTFEERVVPVLPRGLTLIEVEEVALKGVSLQTALRQAEYRVLIEDESAGAGLAQPTAAFLAADRFEFERTRKKQLELVDLRPLVDDLRLEATDEGLMGLTMRVTAGQQGNLRPDTLLAALGLGENAQIRVERTKMVFEFDRE